MGLVLYKFKYIRYIGIPLCSRLQEATKKVLAPPPVASANEILAEMGGVYRVNGELAVSRGFGDARDASAPTNLLDKMNQDEQGDAKAFTTAAGKYFGKKSDLRKHWNKSIGAEVSTVGSVGALTCTARPEMWCVSRKGTPCARTRCSARSVASMEGSRAARIERDIQLLGAEHPHLPACPGARTEAQLTPHAMRRYLGMGWSAKYAKLTRYQDTC